MKEKELLKKYGSPLYVYDSTILESRCDEMRYFQTELATELKKKTGKNITVNMHYSTKSNNNYNILKCVKDSGLMVDCMSELELTVNQRCGFLPNEMLYVCNNIDVEEMKMVYSNKVLICLDSISQVETWGQNFPGTDIMVRINPGTSGVGHSQKVITSGKKTKFGISKENIPELITVAENYNLNIVGTHQHLGSLFLDEKIPEYIDGVKAGLEIVKEYFKNVKIVDLGGGFGVPYKPDEYPLDLNMLSGMLVPVLAEFVMQHDAVEEFKFEPGRFIPCECGRLIGKVTAVKHENGKIYVGTDIGMNQLVRPSMYGSYHEIQTITDEDAPIEKVTFCGNICESGDILGEDREVHIPKVGDIVVVSNAGAYGYSMASNYNGRLRPAEVMIDCNGNANLIRYREKTLDLLANMLVLKN